MQISIDLSGDIVERQELLNGTQSLTLVGRSADGAWAMTGGVSWNLGLVDYTGEGDLALTRADGAELYATLIRARVTDADDVPDADHRFALEYEVDGGSGEFAAAAGRCTAEGTLSGDGFSGVWRLDLTA